MSHASPLLEVANLLMNRVHVGVAQSPLSALREGVNSYIKSNNAWALMVVFRIY